MADETYDVEAKIDVKALTASQGVGGLVRGLLGVQKQAHVAGSGISALLKGTLGFAGAYLGVRTLTSGIRGLVGASFEYATALDTQKTSLAAVLAATQPMYQGISDGAERMNKAGILGGAIFRQLQDDALKSVATSQEMFGIYSSIVGPLAGAGEKLSGIRQVTNDTVAAASVLGVDFKQAARDINQMTTGAAGTDVLLFRMLRATGRIKEDAKAWNALLPEKRIERMKEALQGFAPAAAAFEKTLPGITSSFVDFMQRFRSNFMAGPLEGFRKMLVRMVGIFQKNQERILALLTTAGDMVGAWLEPMYQAIGNATEYFLTHWEEIAERMQRTWNEMKSWGGFALGKAQKFAPTAKAVGAAYLVNKVGSAAVGGSLAGAGMGAINAKLGAALAPIAEVVKDLFAIGAGFQAVILPLTILAGAIGVIVDQWDAVLIFAAPVGMFIQDIFGTLWTLLKSILSVIWPLAKVVGGILLIAFTSVLGIVLSFARLLWPAFRFIIGGWVLIFEYLGKGLEWLSDVIGKTFAGIAKFFGGVLDIGYGVNKPKEKGEESSAGFFDGFMDAFGANFAKFSKQKGEDESILNMAEESNKGKAKKTTINDFRGSKIEVKQDFRDADPDRVWDQTVEAINEGASKRIASALVPDFTR